MQALDSPAWLWRFHSAQISVKYIEFSPSTYTLHVENKILLVYKISGTFFFKLVLQFHWHFLQRSQSTVISQL